MFYPGGHGPLWDLAEDKDSIALIEALYAAGKPVAAVCHGPAAFRQAKGPDGAPLVRGKSVTGFANTEEAAVQLTEVVPFLVEEMLKQSGGRYSKAADWQPYAVIGRQPGDWAEPGLVRAGGQGLPGAAGRGELVGADGNQLRAPPL